MSAYLMFGYYLGDMDSVEWHREQAARFGKDALEDCGGAFDWLLREKAFKDLPNTVAKKTLEAWYTPEDIEDVSYPWSFLQEKKLLTVERVGWCEGQGMVLASYPFLRATEEKPVAEVTDLFLSDAVRRTLTQAYRALNVGDVEAGPRWLLADVSGY